MIKPTPGSPTERFAALVPVIWKQYDAGVMLVEHAKLLNILWQVMVGPHGQAMHSAPDEEFAIVCLQTPEVPRHYLWDIRVVNLADEVGFACAVRVQSLVKIVRSKGIKYGISVGLPAERPILIGDLEVLDAFDHVRYTTPPKIKVSP